MVMKHSMVRLVRRLHRVTGLLVALFLLVISATGIVLNHAERLDLDSVYIPGKLAKLYFGRAEKILGYFENDKHFYLLSEDLYIDAANVRYCGATLDGVESFDQGYLVLCDGSLLWLDQDINIVDWLTVGVGVPQGLVGMGKLEDRVVVSDGKSHYLVDPDLLKFIPVEGEFQVSKRVAIPDEKLMHDSISWHQFVLDFHSGQLFGGLGKLVSDIVAVLFILMAVTGLIIWSRGTKNRF